MSMKSPRLLFGLAVLFTATSVCQAALPPIKEIKGLSPAKSIFKDASATKPVKITSAKEAGKYFGKDDLAKLEKEVDFTKQFVLIFAWRGSGRDKLDVAVAESFPEQIFFSLKRGKTKDLRPHVHVYALRSNVRWKTR